MASSYQKFNIFYGFACRYIGNLLERYPGTIAIIYAIVPSLKNVFK